jgi:hypothetical protein
VDQKPDAPISAPDTTRDLAQADRPRADAGVPDTSSIVLPGPDADPAFLTRAVLMVGVQPLEPGDLAVKNRLEQSGYFVTVYPVLSVEAANKAGDIALMHHVVVISTSYMAGPFGGSSLKQISVGIVCMERVLFPTLGMVPEGSDSVHGSAVDQTSIAIVNTSSPLSAGLRGAAVKVTETPGMFNWGRPAKTAITVAVQPSAKDNALVFAYDRNMPLVNGSPSPGRRVGFFVDVKTVPKLNAAGLALFDAVVRWAAAP